MNYHIKPSIFLCVHVKIPLITPTQKTCQYIQFIGILNDFVLNLAEHFAPLPFCLGAVWPDTTFTLFHLIFPASNQILHLSKEISNKGTDYTFLFFNNFSIFCNKCKSVFRWIFQKTRLDNKKDVRM